MRTSDWPWAAPHASTRSVTNAAYDVIVIGAGMAGLAAARVLSESGKRVAVIEARDRIGGRILTQYHGELAIELGAEFVHGKPRELWDLIHEAGLETYELDGAQFCRQNSMLSECSEDLEGDFKLIEQLKNWRARDVSFQEYLTQANAPEERRQRVIGYVEGFNAADSRIIGVASLGAQQAAEDEIEADRLFRLTGGYARLPQFLEGRVRGANGHVFLSTQAKEVRWTTEKVTVECWSAEGFNILHGKHVIITLPLGVMQCGGFSITPAPLEINQAIDAMRMGNAWRTVLLFRERFWTTSNENIPKLAGLSFLYSFDTNPPAWWTPAPNTDPTLTAWAGGPRADILSKQGFDESKRHLLRTLCEVFAVDEELIRSQLVGRFYHDWKRDPFSSGAYSYVPAGALDASERMTRPVKETLFFAGEHTDTTGHWGTVHGALRSGLRAAKQVLALA